MAKPDNLKLSSNGVRGRFLVVFILVIGGLLSLFWLLFRELELQRKLTETQAELAKKTPQPAVTESKKTSHFSEGEASAVDETGTIISGRVTFLGMPPPEKTIEPLLTDPDCSQFYNQPVKTRFYRVTSDGGFADVYVYVKKGLREKNYPRLTNDFSLDCIQCLFQPYVFALQTSQTLRINNRDGMVHLLSGISKESMIRPGGNYQAHFSASEQFRRLNCSIHPWEFSYVCISEHPYFAVSDADGRFTFPFGLPPGHYTLAAVHRKFGEITQEVDVKGRSQWLNFIFAPSREMLAKLNSESGGQRNSEEKNVSIASSVNTPSRTKDFAQRHRSNVDGVPIAGASRSTSYDPQLGIIRGHVTLKGTPPPEKPIREAFNDPNCGKLRPDVPQTKLYVVDDYSKRLADVFVYIKSGLTTNFLISPEPVVIDQVACQYTPYVVGIQKGQMLEVRNSDPVLHNVHFVPNTPGNKESNKAQMPGSKPLQYFFAEPELFLRLKCDVHPWMFAYVCVVDHPFFAVTDEEGFFMIVNVPPGNYEVEAIHRKAGAQAKPVTVSSITDIGRPADLRFELTAKP